MESALLKALRRLQPAKVVLVNGDTRRPVHVKPGSARRKRWEAVDAVAAKMPWTQAELLSATDDLLDVVDKEGPAGDAEELSPPSRLGVDARDERMLALVIRAQEVQSSAILRAQEAALANQRNETQHAMTALVSCVGAVTQAVQTMSRIHQATVQAALDLGSMQPPSEEEREPSAMEKAMEAAAPVVMGRLMGSIAGGGK